MSQLPRSITFTERQLQKKFKHASDLGISDSYSKESAKAFADALNDHVADLDVQQIVGTFRRRAVIHYFKEATSIDVLTEADGTWISVWKLNDKQRKNLVERGSL
ncbi:MAG: colicin D domain-containing protein [Chloroflexota bacterium]